MSQLNLIGLAGTNGSGKDTVGHLLAENHNFLFVSVTELLRDELKRRGQDVTRENLRTLSAEWRRQDGLGVLIDRAVEAYQNSSHSYAGLAVSSLRNPGEVDRVHELGGRVVWVDADPKLRYERIQSGAVARGRAGEDAKTFEEFLAEEEIEMNPTDKTSAETVNMSSVRDMSDIKLINESNLDNFKLAAERALEI